jgi:ERCC4-related helicase
MHIVGQDIKLKFVVDNQLQANEAQATAIDKFSKGQYHILVATSVAEEG